MQEVLGNIHEEMDLPTFFRWLDEGKPPAPVGGEENEERSIALSLSMRSDTLLTDMVCSAQEDIQHKLQQMVDNIRTRVSTN